MQGSTMAWTPVSSSSAAYLLAVSTSSRKFTEVMPAGLTIDGVPSSVMPMKPTDALDLPDRPRGEDRLAGVLVDGVRREIGKVGAEVRVAVLAAVDRMASTVLQPQEFYDTLVELVIADRGDVHLQQVQRLDRGLVMECGAQQRCGTDHVACASGQCLLALGIGIGPQLLERGGQVLRTASRYAVDRSAAAAQASSAPWKSLNEKKRALATSPRAWLGGHRSRRTSDDATHCQCRRCNGQQRSAAKRFRSTQSSPLAQSPQPARIAPRQCHPLSRRSRSLQAASAASDGVGLLVEGDDVAGRVAEARGLGCVHADRLYDMAAMCEHCLDAIGDAVDHDVEEQPWLFGRCSAGHPCTAYLAEAVIESEGSVAAGAGASQRRHGRNPRRLRCRWPGFPGSRSCRGLWCW